MENGLNLERGEPLRKRHGGGAAPVAGAKVDPFVLRSEHSPRELRSWAKRTGFVSDYSGEATGSTTTSASERVEVPNHLHQRVGGVGGASSPKIEIDPVLGRLRNNNNRGNEIQHDSSLGGGVATTRTENDNGRGNGNEPVLALNLDGERMVGLRGNANGNWVVNRDSNGHGTSTVAPVPEQKEEEGRRKEMSRLMCTLKGRILLIEGGRVHLD